MNGFIYFFLKGKSNATIREHPIIAKVTTIEDILYIIILLRKSQD